MEAVIEGKKAGQATKLRRCIVSREAGKADDMIRFCIDPQGQLVADIKGNLPGRGAWLFGRRSLIEKAIKHKSFARALKMAVDVPANLADDVDKLLKRAALMNLSLARRGGVVITGATKIENAVRAKPSSIAILLHAIEAAEDGKRKLAQAVYSSRKSDISAKTGAAGQKTIKILSPFTAEELQFTFGGHNVMHLAITNDKGAAGLIKALNRLEAYREKAA